MFLDRISYQILPNEIFSGHLTFDNAIYLHFFHSTPIINRKIFFKEKKFLKSLIDGISRLAEASCGISRLAFRDLTEASCLSIVIIRSCSSQNQVLALAQRLVAIDKFGIAPALLTEQTLTTRARPRPWMHRKYGYLCISSRLAIYVLVWDLISLSCACPALSEASKTPGQGRAFPRVPARADTGRNPSASGSSESLGQSRAFYRAPCQYKHGPRAGASESQDSVGQELGLGCARKSGGAGRRRQVCPPLYFFSLPFSHFSLHPLNPQP